MKTIKTILLVVISIMIGAYALPMYNAVVIERDRQRVEMVQQQKRIERAIKDSKRGLLGKVLVVPVRDFINKF